MTYPTRFTVAGQSDGMCWARSCMWPGEDKGTFVQGRGYTSYHSEPRPICHQNATHGCPNPLPNPDPEAARCCFRPEYHKRGSAPPRWRECSTCGSHAPRGAWKMLNALSSQEGVPCKHEGDSEPTMLRGWFQCPTCRGLWDHRPRMFDVGQFTFDEYLVVLEQRWAQATAIRSADPGADKT